MRTKHDLSTRDSLKDPRISQSLMAVGVVGNVSPEFRGMDKRSESHATHTTTCSGF